MIVLYGLSRLWLTTTSGMTATDSYSQLSGMLVLRLLALAAAIFASAVISQEVEQKTIVYLLTRPVARWKQIAIRTLAASTVVFAIGVAAGVAVAGATFGPAALASDLLRRDLVTVAFGALAYTSLFVLVSLLINRSLIVCLLFAFGWETSAQLMPGDLYYVSIYSYLTALADHPLAPQNNNALVGALSGGSKINDIGIGTALPLLIIIIASCLGLSMWWFSRFEFVPREDTE